MGRVILIVEDDPKNLKLIRDLLQIRGYTTLEATDGKQGVDMAREKMPDLILMDIQMPVMDGFEAISILKAEPCNEKYTYHRFNGIRHARGQGKVHGGRM